MFYSVVRVLARAFCRVFFKVRIVNEENMPKDGSCLVCANHSSNWDPVFLILFMKRKINIMAKNELFSIKPLKYVLEKFGAFPVKRGQADIGAIKKSISLLTHDEVMGMFPTGTRTSDDDLSSVKAGAALIGTRTGTKIVPVYIKSKYRIFSSVTITYGKTIDLFKYKGQKLSSEQLAKISEDIYKNIIKLSK